MHSNFRLVHLESMSSVNEVQTDLPPFLILLLHFMGRPFVKRFALCFGAVVCPVCLSLTLVHCSQTIGWIKVPLGMDVGPGPGNIMLDWDPASPTERVTAALTFQPMSTVAKRSPISVAAELLLVIWLAGSLGFLPRLSSKRTVGDDGTDFWMSFLSPNQEC